MDSCIAHTFHAPKPTYVEYHHVIPQAWQHFKLGTDKLFDPRTVALCRTGHGNVHYWLVRLMKGLDTKGANKKELAIAEAALTRYTDQGGDLNALRTAGEFGEI